METTAPSGKFWIAIPSESANAPARLIPEFPASSPANTTPTAIPSGILCKVTARQSIVVSLSFTCKPSGFSEFMCKWGIIISNRNRKAIPKPTPITAGRNASRPKSAEDSMEGIISDQTLAATMTPLANPRRSFCSFSFICCPIKKTQAEPKTVPKKGIISP